MQPRYEIILVDDEEHIRKSTSQTLELEGFYVTAWHRGAQILARLSDNFHGIVISDIKMPELDGLALLKKIVSIDADLPVVLMTGHGDIEMAVQAMREGAYDFIEKPFAPGKMLETVCRAMEKRKLILENRSMLRQLDRFSGIEGRLIGTSPAMQGLREMVRNVAPTDADVLILGETGTGKEQVARSLHEASGRADKAFVAINCGAIPESIFESELFGHEAGAFTGAQKARVGKFEFANGGTLFLDEIEAMPLDLQVKILRVIQERAIERLGDNRVIALDVRIIAASKVDLRQAVAAGGFREDLFYRLNVVTCEIPPLRARGEDIAQLFRHFVLLAARRFKRDVREIDPGKILEILSRPWPGNVRELQNSADRYALGLPGQYGTDATVELTENSSLAERLENFEKIQIEDELKRQKGRIKQTYEALGIGRKTLYDKMQKYGLSAHDIRDAR